MSNISCKIKRMLALALALAFVLAASPALAASYSAAVTADTLPVYANAALSKRLATLDKYSIVTVTGEKSGVARLSYKGYTVYAELSRIVAVEDFATEATINANTRVYAAADTSSKSAALKAGTQVNVLANAGDWSVIEKNTNVGYVQSAYLAGATVAPTDTEDPFLPTTTPSATAPSDAVVIEELPATVSAASVKVYKGASTSSKKLGTLKYGQSVTICAYNSEWAYIELNGKRGFCLMSALSKTPQVTPTPTPGATENPFDIGDVVAMTVTAASVKVYKSASTSAKKLGTLPKGAEVSLIKSSENWAYIELNGNYGYCQLAALTKTSELTDDDKKDDDGGESIGGKTPLGSCTVITATASVYASKSAGTAVAKLSMGDALSVYAYDSKWVTVGVSGKLGYVLRSSLSASSYAALKSEDSGSAVTELQGRLLALGYFDGTPTVNYTAQTVSAVERLQTACGMTKTGEADINTLRVLYAGNAPASPMLSVSLSSGSVNENVTRLQTRLYSLGYLSRASSIDGDYGSTTAAAVKLFQSAAGIGATGTADNASIRALYAADAPTLPSGSKPADTTSTTPSGGGTTTTGTMPAGLASTTSSYSEGMSNAQKLEYAIYCAQNQLGKPYVYGSTGMSSFDCSGLTYYAFKQIGITLKRTAYSEGYNDARTKISDVGSLKRGDTVFFNTVSDSDMCDHTGIFLGSAYFIHASSGAGKVVVSNLSSGYYNRVFSWGRRILNT